MKLFLTSGGLINSTLQKKFLELVGKDPKNIKIALIDTASKVEKDRSYVAKTVETLIKIGLNTVTLIDISEPRENWIDTLTQADVVWVEGGNTFYLLNEIRKAGLHKELKKLINGKVYVGVSAGSILITPSIEIAKVEPADANNTDLTDFSGLGWVDFEVSPHTPDTVPLVNVENYARTLKLRLYAYDDNVALTVIDGNVEIVGKGFCKLIK